MSARNVCGCGAATLREFWPRSSVFSSDLSLEDCKSCHETATLPEQCDHAKAIPGVDARCFDREWREIAILVNYLSRGGRAASVDPPGMTAVENYALFVWGSGPYLNNRVTKGVVTATAFFSR